MRLAAFFSVGALSVVGGYLIGVRQCKPHLVQVIDQGKPGKQILSLNDPALLQHDCNYYDLASGRPSWCAPIQIIDARDPLIVALGQAIAREEGFGKPGALATVNHNPGNLIYAHQEGAGIAIMLGDSGGYATFLTDDAGWAALYADLRAKKAMHCSIEHLDACCPGGSEPMTNDACMVYAIAYNWSTGDREKYARDIVADLKARGLLK